MRILTAIGFLWAIQTAWCAPCARVAVVVKDKLENLKPLDPKDGRWFRDRIAKKYGLCYASIEPGSYDVVFYIQITPTTATVERTHRRSTSSAIEEDGANYDLFLQHPVANEEKLQIAQRFQRWGHNGIPRALIEDAAKWLMAHPTLDSFR